MIRHRGLDLQKFIVGLDWDLFVRYFDQVATDLKPGVMEWFHPDRLGVFLSAEENVDATAGILEDFQRVNDLARANAGFLEKASRYARAVWPATEPPVSFSMRLFLDYRDAFEYAWTLFVLQATTSKRCEFYFPAGKLEPTLTQVETFRASLSGWFDEHHQGNNCLASRFNEEERALVRIVRGSQLKTFALWRGNVVTFETFRAASEDVVIYEPGRQVLSLLGVAKREREQFIRAFGTCIAESPDLADIALGQRIYSLEPLRQENFSYAGNAAIRRISLIEVSMQDPSLWKGLWTLRSENVIENLKLYNIRLRDVEVTRIKLRMEIQTESEKRPSDVVVEIEPPGISDLPQKRHRTIIESYLRAQGVKLI